MCYKPLHIKNRSLNPNAPTYIDVPCGKCCECLKKQRNDWKIRLHNEYERTLKNGGSVFFCTATFDNEHLPTADRVTKTYVLNPLYIARPDVLALPSYLVKDHNGDIVFHHPYGKPSHELMQDKYIEITKTETNVPCFDYKVVRDFLKRLRINCTRYLDKDLRLRYFIASEYGDTTARPHFHPVIFTNKFVSLALFDKVFRNSWNAGFILDVQTPRSADKVNDYVSKYVTKQIGSTMTRKQELSFMPWLGKYKSFIPRHFQSIGFGDIPLNPVNSKNGVFSYNNFIYSLPKYNDHKIHGTMTFVDIDYEEPTLLSNETQVDGSIKHTYGNEKHIYYTKYASITDSQVLSNKVARLTQQVLNNRKTLRSLNSFDNLEKYGYFLDIDISTYLDTPVAKIVNFLLYVRDFCTSNIYTNYLTEYDCIIKTDVLGKNTLLSLIPDVQTCFKLHLIEIALSDIRYIIGSFQKEPTFYAQEKTKKFKKLRTKKLI